MFRDLILKNRSYRRFYQDKPVETEVLRQLIDLARLSPNGANRQALRYMIANINKINEAIYNNIGWAGYYKNWDGPEEGEKPSAYIIILKEISAGIANTPDEGIAGQSILLGATEKGLGGCFIGNINRQNLARDINLDEKYSIQLVIALGYPKEQVVLEEINITEDIKYWRDENQVHHVPKIALEDIIVDYKG
jgi:nitroreductase